MRPSLLLRITGNSGIITNMSLRIHFSSSGRHGQRLHQIIVSEKNGKAKDLLGYYHPEQKENPLTIDQNRYEEWIKKGAQPSESLKSLLKK